MDANQQSKFIADWNQFLKTYGDQFPILYEVNKAPNEADARKLWGEFIQSNPDQHFESNAYIFEGKIQSEKASETWQENRGWQENPSGEEQLGTGTGVSNAIGLGFGLLFKPEENKLLEYDPVYQEIQRQLREDWNAKNPDATPEQKLQYKYGHLVGDEKSLNAETEKTLRETKIKNKNGEEVLQYKRITDKYDEMEKTIYKKNYRQDPRIGQIGSDFQNYVDEANGHRKKNGQADLTDDEIKALRQRVWKNYVAKNPEKAVAYKDQNDEIKEALEKYQQEQIRRKRIEDLERKGVLRNTDEQLELTRARAQEQGENEKAKQQQQGGTNIQLSSRPTPAEAIPEGIEGISQEEEQLKRLEELRGKPGFLMGAEEKFELENLERQFAAAVGEEALGEAALAPEAIAGAEAAEAGAARAEEKNVVGGLLGKRGERNAARKATRLAGRAERKAERKLAFTVVRTALPVIGPIIAVIVIVLILMLGPLGGGGGETTPASADNNPPQSNQPNIASCVTLDIQPPTQNIKINDAVTYNVHVVTNNCPETIAVRYKLPADQGLGYLNPTTPKTGTKPNENQLECDFSKLDKNLSADQLTCNQTATSDHQVIWDLSKAGSCSPNPNEYDLKLCLRALKATTSTTTPMTDVFFDALPLSQIQQSAQTPQTTTQRQGGDLVILGDSITVLAFSNADKGIINFAVNGTTTNDGLTKIKDALNTYPTDKFFGIAYGSQDAENKVPLNSFQQNLESIIATITTAGAVPILATIPPRSPNLKLPGNQFDVKPYNGIITNLIKKHNLTSGPDLYSYFQQHSTYYHDYVHPNQSGINGIRSLWEETLKNLK